MIDDQEQMKENFPKIFGQYHFMRVIGRGAYGVVICAQDIFEQEFAVKVISREFLKSTNSFLSFEQELRVHQSLDHFNIVKIREVLYEPEYIYVVMDLCSRGDLFTFISEESPLPLTLIRNIFFQILQGVRYLHNKDIAHLDLKPDNILMTGDNIVKISDFGFCEAPPKRTLPGAAGTLYYSAPEIISKKFCSNLPADIWSLGIVLFAMSSGSLPWIPGNDDEIGEQIMKGNLSYPNDLNSAVFRIVNKCCQVDRNDRPTIDELINDPWFENERAKLAAQTSSLMNSPNILMSQPRVSSSMNPSFSGAGNKSVLGSGVLGKGLSTSVGLFPSTSANMTGYLPKRNFCGITGTVNLPASGSLRSVFNSYNKKKLIIVRPVESQEVVRVNGSQSLAKFTLTRAPMKTHKENIITSGLQ